MEARKKIRWMGVVVKKTRLRRPDKVERDIATTPVLLCMHMRATMRRAVPAPHALRAARAARALHAPHAAARTESRITRIVCMDTSTHPGPHIHAVVQLAYFASRYSCTPHPVHMLETLAHECLRERRVGHASHILCELTRAPLAGACEASDDVFRTALCRGVQALGRASSTYEPLYARATHPAFAAAAVYDACADANVRMPCAGLSSLIATLARHVPGSTLRELLRVMAADVTARPPSPHTPSALASIIAAYGRAGAPLDGERFLQTYAQQHGASHTVQRLAPHHVRWARRLASCRHRPLDIPLYDAWSSHTDVWNALVRARAVNGHMVQARVWLERYRLCAATLAPSLHAARLLPPVKSASPYLTFMHGLSTSDGIHQFLRHISAEEYARLAHHATQADAPYKTAAIYDVLHMVRRDRVVPGVAMLNFLASFEAGCGRIDRGARFALDALDLERGPTHALQRVHPTSICAASAPRRGFQMHISSVPVLATLYAAHAKQVVDVASLVPCTSTPWQRDVPGMDLSLRAILAQAVELVAGKQPMSARQRRHVRAWLAKKGTSMLNALLAAALWTNDFHSARRVLSLFTQWHMIPNTYTHLVILERLAPHAQVPMSMDGTRAVLEDIIQKQAQVQAQAQSRKIT